MSWMVFVIKSDSAWCIFTHMNWARNCSFINIDIASHKETLILFRRWLCLQLYRTSCFHSDISIIKIDSSNGKRAYDIRITGCDWVIMKHARSWFNWFTPLFYFLLQYLHIACDLLRINFFLFFHISMDSPVFNGNFHSSSFEGNLQKICNDKNYIVNLKLHRWNSTLVHTE